MAITKHTQHGKIGKTHKNLSTPSRFYLRSLIKMCTAADDAYVFFSLVFFRSPTVVLLLNISSCSAKHQQKQQQQKCLQGTLSLSTHRTALCFGSLWLQGVCVFFLFCFCHRPWPTVIKMLTMRRWLLSVIHIQALSRSFVCFSFKFMHSFVP